MYITIDSARKIKTYLYLSDKEISELVAKNYEVIEVTPREATGPVRTFLLDEDGIRTEVFQCQNLIS